MMMLRMLRMLLLMLRKLRQHPAHLLPRVTGGLDEAREGAAVVQYTLRGRGEGGAREDGGGG